MVQGNRLPIFMSAIGSLLLHIGCSGGLPATAPPPQPSPPMATREGQEYPGARLMIGPRGELYQTLSEKGPLGVRLLFRRSPDFGATWEPPTVVYESKEVGVTVSRPDIEIDGKGGVYLAWWVKLRGAKGIYFKRSQDGGRTWSEATHLVNKGSPFPPALTADSDGHLYVMWQEEERLPWHILLTVSRDSGATWLKEPIRFTDYLSRTGRVHGPRLALGGGGHVYVVWQEFAGMPRYLPRIALTRSSDFGATWLSHPVSLWGLSEPKGVSAIRPSIVADREGRVLVAWHQAESQGSNIFYTRSADGGVTWSQPAVRLNDPLPPPSLSTYPLFLDAGRGKLYAIWTGQSEQGRQRIAFRRSPDFGATWEPQIHLDRTASDTAFSATPLIAADAKGGLFVAWQQWEPRRWREYRVFITRSDDFGKTWLPEPVRLDTLPQSRLAERPIQLIADGDGRVYVSWGGDPFGKQDFFLNRSLDGGRTWLPKEAWLTDPSTLFPTRPAGQ